MRITTAAIAVTTKAMTAAACAHCMQQTLDTLNVCINTVQFVGLETESL